MLVFLLSIVGIIASFVIGVAAGFLLSWLSTVWLPLDVITFRFMLAIFGSTASFYALTYFPSLSLILSVAVLAALFGLPLARMAKGKRFVDAWNDQAGKRWPLFWKCGVGALVVSIVWTTASLVAYSFFRTPPPSDLDTGISQMTFYQPTLLEMSSMFGMQLMLMSICAGLVAYFAERLRQQVG